MRSTIFNDRLQTLKKSEKYTLKALQQIEEIFSENEGKLPKRVYLSDLGRRTISNLLCDLGYPNFDIIAPNGSSSSLREIILL